MVQTRLTDTLCIGDGCPLALIGGPCVIESEDFTLQMAEAIANLLPPQRCLSRLYATACRFSLSDSRSLLSEVSLLPTIPVY